jgi:hypothetical protein
VNLVLNLDILGRQVVVIFRVALTLALCSAPHTLCAQTAHPQFPVTDGSVHALAVSGNVLYVGGEFRMIGRPTGAGVPVDTTTGVTVTGYPLVHGIVYAAVDDGMGGWFVGGAFDRVGNASRANLARIRSDFSVDPWNPGTNDTVRTSP